VIVLDAVDELPRDSLEALLKLIADKFGDLPSFVRLFIAVRCFQLFMIMSQTLFPSSRFPPSLLSLPSPLLSLLPLARS